MNESLSQFYLDVPRIDVFVEGIKTESPDTVLAHITQKLPSYSEHVIYMLTQTFLAKFYIEEYNRRIIDDECLLDNGNYIVNITGKIINIEKDFKLVYFHDDTFYILNYCTLSITLCLDDMIAVYAWNYVLDSTNTPVSINLKYDIY
jgi:hypothetical protein